MTQGKMGDEAVLEISTDGGSTYNALGELTDISLSGGREGAEATNFDSDLEVERLVGNRDKSVSVTGNYVPGDGGQAAARDAEESGDIVKLRLRPAGTVVGNEQFVADVIITDFSINLTQNEVQEFSADFDQASGWVRSTQ